MFALVQHHPFLECKHTFSAGQIPCLIIPFSPTIIHHRCLSLFGFFNNKQLDSHHFVTAFIDEEKRHICRRIKGEIWGEERETKGMMLLTAVNNRKYAHGLIQWM